MVYREMDSDNHNAPCFSLAGFAWLSACFRETPPADIRLPDRTLIRPCDPLACGHGELRPKTAARRFRALDFSSEPTIAVPIKTTPPSEGLFKLLLSPAWGSKRSTANRSFVSWSLEPQHYQERFAWFPPALPINVVEVVEAESISSTSRNASASSISSRAIPSSAGSTLDPSYVSSLRVLLSPCWGPSATLHSAQTLFISQQLAQ